MNSLMLSMFSQTILCDKFDVISSGETANSVERPHTQCRSQESGGLCGEKECFSCNSVREADSEVVRGTLLVRIGAANIRNYPHTISKLTSYRYRSRVEPQ